MKDATLNIFFCAGCYLIPCNFAILSRFVKINHITLQLKEWAWNDPKLTTACLHIHEPHPQPNLFMATISVYAVCHAWWVELSNN